MTEHLDAIQSALTEVEFRGFCKGQVVRYMQQDRISEAQPYLNRLSGGSDPTPHVIKGEWTDEGLLHAIENSTVPFEGEVRAAFVRQLRELNPGDLPVSIRTLERPGLWPSYLRDQLGAIFRELIGRPERCSWIYDSNRCLGDIGHSDTQHNNGRKTWPIWKAPSKSWDHPDADPIGDIERALGRPPTPPDNRSNELLVQLLLDGGQELTLGDCYVIADRIEQLGGDSGTVEVLQTCWGALVGPTRRDVARVLDRLSPKPEPQEQTTAPPYTGESISDISDALGRSGWVVPPIESLMPHPTPLPPGSAGWVNEPGWSNPVYHHRNDCGVALCGDEQSATMPIWADIPPGITSDGICSKCIDRHVDTRGPVYFYELTVLPKSTTSSASLSPKPEPQDPTDKQLLALLDSGQDLSDVEQCLVAQRIDQLVDGPTGTVVTELINTGRIRPHHNAEVAATWRDLMPTDDDLLEMLDSGTHLSEIGQRRVVDRIALLINGDDYAADTAVAELIDTGRFPHGQNAMVAALWRDLMPSPEPTPGQTDAFLLMMLDSGAQLDLDRQRQVIARISELTGDNEYETDSPMAQLLNSRQFSVGANAKIATVWRSLIRNNGPMRPPCLLVDGSGRRCGLLKRHDGDCKPF